MKRSKLTLVFFFGFLLSSAQDTTITRRQLTETLLFSGSHVSVSLIPFMNAKATIEEQKGPYSLGSTRVRGGEVGIDYHFHFSQFYSIRIGLHGSASIRNYTFFVPKEDYTPEIESDFIETGTSSQTVDFYASLPLMLEGRWFTKNNNHWNLTAGIRLGYYPDEFSESTTYGQRDVTGQTFDAMKLRLEVGNNFQPWVDYLVGGGYTWLLSNNNLLRLNLLANFSKIQVAKGRYEIIVPGKEISTGTYASNFSYLGFSISYFFTGTNKRLVREYQTRRPND